MVKGHDKKEKRIIKLKNKTMPKFAKNTDYQMPAGNSPHKFIGRLLGGIFGRGGGSKPKEIAGLHSGSRYASGNAQGSHYGIGVTGHRLNKPLLAGAAGRFGGPVVGGLGMSKNFGFLGAGLSGGAQRRAASALGTGGSKIDLLTGLPKRFSPRSVVDRFASGRKRRRNIGNSLRGLLS